METAKERNRIQLPAAVLTAFVFPFVGVKTLKRCACVSKEWRAAVDEDVVWRRQCITLWKNKKNVPRIIWSPGNDEEPESLYPYALYGPQVKLSIKEIRQILSARDISVDKFIEKSEFQRALELSQPRSTNGWSAQYTSKWKTSYVYSAVRAVADRITRHELITKTWKMSFKYNGMTCESRFNGDGSYWSTLGDIPNQQGKLSWIFVPNSDGNGFDFGAIRVAEYPQLVVHRTSDWGFELHNDYVVLCEMQTQYSGN